MISDNGNIKPEKIHGFDGSLIMIRRRNQGTRSNQIARTDHNVIRVVTNALSYVGCQIISTTNGYRLLPYSVCEAAWRLKTPVEVVKCLYFYRNR